MKFTKTQWIAITALIVPTIIGLLSLFSPHEPTQKISDSPDSINTLGQTGGTNIVNRASLLIEVPTGPVNGINLVFVVSHKPVYLNEDGIDRFEYLDYTYIDHKITFLNIAEAPTYAIRSFYATDGGNN